MQKGEEDYYENKHDFALVIPQGDIGQSGLSSTPLKWGGFPSACPKSAYKWISLSVTVRLYCKFF
jgi:hypothetical protein